MIITRLIGGLGNQFFQYAVGRRLAMELQVPLKLDLSWYKNHHYRKFELDKFKTQIDIASEEEIQRVKFLFRNRAFGRLFSISQKFLPRYRRRAIEEKVFGVFDPKILKIPRTCHLTGYWQSEFYFNPIATQIIQEFTLREPLHPVHQKYAENIRTTNAVCIHVRRTDYIDDPKNAILYHTCTGEYYQQAAQILSEKYSDLHYFIFSDDMHWAKENMKLIHPMTFIEIEGVNRNYEGVMLMSLCRHFIIANSTFSWWGAWLSRNPEKVVIAPKLWFKNNLKETRDLIPRSWTRL